MPRGFYKHELGADANNYRHGLSGTQAYSRWWGIKQRCYYPKAVRYKWYGARGIGMFEPWRLSVGRFWDDVLAEIGPCPPKHTLDRINNNGNYEPGNIRWATYSEQRTNR